MSHTSPVQSIHEVEDLPAPLNPFLPEYQKPVFPSDLLEAPYQRRYAGGREMFVQPDVSNIMDIVEANALSLINYFSGEIVTMKEEMKETTKSLTTLGENVLSLTGTIEEIKDGLSRIAQDQVQQTVFTESVSSILQKVESLSASLATLKAVPVQSTGVPLGGRAEEKRPEVVPGESQDSKKVAPSALAQESRRNDVLDRIRKRMAGKDGADGPGGSGGPKH